MLKLAVVVDTFPRWSERFIARELSELRRRKVDFDVFCLAAGRLPTAANEEPEWLGLLERRKVLPSACSVKEMVSALGRMPKLKKSLYARVRADIAEELGLVDLLKLARAHALEKALVDGKYGHVHAHFAGLTSSIAWLATRNARVPLSISVHARDLFVEPQLLSQKLADCARVFTCHEHARQYLVSQATNKADSERYRERVLLMRHGLPMDQFPFKARNGHSPSRERPFRILAAGRFVPKKGFNHLIEALAHPGLAEKNVELKFIGDGPERATLQKQIRASKLKNVSFEPPLSGPELRDAFAQANVFAAPYLESPDGDIDGVPNVVLEAFAIGLPVIGTRTGGLGEVLTNETGTIIPDSKPESIAFGILTVLDSRKEAHLKSKIARDLIERDYNIRKNIKPLMELFS